MNIYDHITTYNEDEYAKSIKDEDRDVMLAIWLMRIASLWPVCLLILAVILYLIRAR